MLFLHNLGRRGATVNVGKVPGVAPDVHEVFADRAYPAPRQDLGELRVGPYGYRWLRLSHRVGAQA
jgi:maltose alpha-D-glucosyltransferase / alpha-amylase